MGALSCSGDETARLIAEGVSPEEIAEHRNKKLTKNKNVYFGNLFTFSSFDPSTQLWSSV